jgi:hypothetical protein
MIVIYKQTGWEIITQRAHGMVAAQLAMQWKVEERPKRWVETLLAIAEHDDAEVELDGENLLTALGGPLNYSMKRFDLQHCEELSMLTITKSRYIALLVSMHMEFLHRGEEKENHDAHQFLNRQRALQAQWRNELGLENKELERIYYLLEWCDAFSLLLCEQKIQPEKRGIEISTGPNGANHVLYQIDDRLLTVDPWPFEPESFKITYESREVNRLQFSDSADFRTAFINAKVKENEWTITKTMGSIKKPEKV